MDKLKELCNKAIARCEAGKAWEFERHFADVVREDERNKVLKNCTTCGHRLGSSTFAWAKCMRSGFYCEVERKHPTHCGKDFEGWVPRPSMFSTIKQLFTKKS